MTADTRTLENRFLGTVQAMVGIACTTRQFAKALIDLPESVEASEAMTEALMAGIPKERLRTIAKACQGDSRRGREMAARLSAWIDAPREVAKAIEEPAPVVTPAKDQPDTRTAIKALRERLDGEAREVAKAHHEASHRTVGGKIVNVAGYETHMQKAQAGAVRLSESQVFKGPHALAMTLFANDATKEAHDSNTDGAPAEKHAWAAEQHGQASLMHEAIAHHATTSYGDCEISKKANEVAGHHKALQAYHQGKAEGATVSDTTPALNTDDNQRTASKETIHPKTDMVD